MRRIVFALAVICDGLGSGNAGAQSLRAPWAGYGHDAQHTAISPVPSQPLNRILWQTPVDLNPQYNGSSLLIHYGSPLITRSNTVIVPVKVGATSGFKVEGRVGTNGVLKWTHTTDFRLPPHSWTPSFAPTLTPQNRLYFPGGGGTVYYRDTPDAATGATGQIAFFGLANFNANTNAYLANVMINTPLTADRYGNIYFGFQVTNATPVALTSGVARIDVDGNGTWISASNMVADGAMTKVVHNCAPALANDHKTLYIAVRGASYGYLVALDSRTLAPLAKSRLKDAKTPANDASLPDDGTASPTVGPDGDVYFGVLGNPAIANHYRGWLLHFNSSLTQTNPVGAFGWDDTASIVPASMVPSYTNGSPYLLMVKYNNYYQANGDGVNKLAILDPRATMTDPISGVPVMKDVLTVTGPTPDAGVTNTFPNAVREWCINTAAVDPFTRSVLVNNEDGKLYRWSLDCNMLMQPVTLTAGIGEAYTPTLIGVDGIVYAINNGILFAVGR